MTVTDTRVIMTLYLLYILGGGWKLIITTYLILCLSHSTHVLCAAGVVFSFPSGLETGGCRAQPHQYQWWVVTESEMLRWWRLDDSRCAHLLSDISLQSRSRRRGGCRRDICIQRTPHWSRQAPLSPPCFTSTLWFFKELFVVWRIFSPNI